VYPLLLSLLFLIENTARKSKHYKKKLPKENPKNKEAPLDPGRASNSVFFLNAPTDSKKPSFQ
jgi:hypothetical protein